MLATGPGQLLLKEGLQARTGDPRAAPTFHRDHDVPRGVVEESGEAGDHTTQFSRPTLLRTARRGLVAGGLVTGEAGETLKIRAGQSRDEEGKSGNHQHTIYRRVRAHETSMEVAPVGSLGAKLVHSGQRWGPLERELLRLPARFFK